jgi:hypothetical protein
MGVLTSDCSVASARANPQAALVLRDLISAAWGDQRAL